MQYTLLSLSEEVYCLHNHQKYDIVVLAAYYRTGRACNACSRMQSAAVFQRTKQRIFGADLCTFVPSFLRWFATMRSFSEYIRVLKCRTVYQRFCTFPK